MLESSPQMFTKQACASFHSIILFSVSEKKREEDSGIVGRRVIGADSSAELIGNEIGDETDTNTNTDTRTNVERDFTSFPGKKK